MKVRNRVDIFLLSVLLLCLGGCGGISDKSESNKSEQGGNEKTTLSLTLNLDKTVYTLDEKIDAEIILKNIETRNTTVNSRMAVMLIPALNKEGEGWGELLYVFESPSGNQVSNNGNWRIRFLVESDFIVLGPRRGVLESHELRQFFILDEIGTYSVHVIYQNLLDSPKGLVAWKGQLTSNTVIFEIKP